jgi:S1-C subfamily serine protease
MRIRTFAIALMVLMAVVAVGTRTGAIPSLKKIFQSTDKAGSDDLFSEPIIGKAAGLTADEVNTIDIYKLARNATVHITSTTYVQDFWSFQPTPKQGSGTGFVIREDGLILTNFHVISGDQQPEVTLPEIKKSFPARILAKDRTADLALIKIEPAGRKFAALKLGDSEALQVGQKVLAIGNPFQFDFTLTTGIISSLGRSLRTESGTLEGMVQTDAAINPGNSGGPLLDSQGHVIGINTAIFGPQGNIGIGFALPINRAKVLIEDYAAGRPTGPVWFGAETFLIQGDLAEALDLPTEGGLLVSAVYRGSPAAKSGIRGARQEVQVGRYIIPVGGDLIMAVDGQKVDSRDSIVRMMQKKRPNDSLTLDVFRGGQRIKIKVTLDAAPDNFNEQP